jgi:hypothetical protein
VGIKISRFMRLIEGLAVDMTRKGALVPAQGSKKAVQQTSMPEGVAAAKRDEKPATAARFLSTASRNLMTNYLTRMPNTKRLRDDKASGRTRRPRTAPRDEEGCEVEQ